MRETNSGGNVAKRGASSGINRPSKPQPSIGFAFLCTALTRTLMSDMTVNQFLS